MNVNILLNVCIIIVLITFIGFIASVSYIVIKGEKKQKLFHQNMKIGDECDYHTVYNTNPGIISKINEDTVEVTTIIQKRFIYPKKS